MALGIGTDGLITLGRQGTGDGVITTDIGTTVIIGIITDGGGSKAIEYAKLYGRSHHALIRGYDDGGSVIETRDYTGDFKE